MKICVYRIVQESLTNAFRHAGGTGQQVEAKLQGKHLELRVSDQGAQFAKQHEHHTDLAKLGHRGIRNRVQAFGGTLDITKTMTGTNVLVSLPLDHTGEVVPVSETGA